jgi:hypothetical protein
MVIIKGKTKQHYNNSPYIHELSSIQMMKQGNRCEKADVILAIKAGVDKLPDTSLIATECESYLEGTADEAQLAAMTMRQQHDSEKSGN